MNFYKTILLILIGCNLHYSLLAFDQPNLLSNVESKIKDSRGCQSIVLEDINSASVKLFLENRCNQKYQNCEEIFDLKPSSTLDSVFYLLLLGDCNLFSPEQNSSVAYESYLLALNTSSRTKSKILEVEVLKKMISFNLFAATVENETRQLINRHKRNAYDALEIYRNKYYQLRVDYPASEKMGVNEEAIKDWNSFIEEIGTKYPKLESEIRSYYGAYLDMSGLPLEAEQQLLESITAARKVNDKFYEDAKYSSFANIGFLKLNNNEPERALDYFTSAQSIKSKMSSAKNASLVYNWTAEAYNQLNKSDSAYHYLTLAQEKTKEASEFEHATRIQEIQSKYDNEKLNNELLVEQGKKQRSNYFMVFFIGLSLISLLIYRNQKIKNSATKKELENAKLKATLDKQKALEIERVRIAAEMHDDLGGGLTTIKFLSQKVLRSIDSTSDKMKVEKIVSHSKNLVSNMSEIIWAMNAGFDTLDSLMAYTRRYASEYFDDHEIDFHFKIEGEFDDIILTGEKRRSIFLVIKEALHNIVKHADASKAAITFTVRENIKISIEDNGIGFNDEFNQLGNGLKNMRNRIQKLNGEVNYKTMKGACIEIEIPVNN